MNKFYLNKISNGVDKFHPRLDLEAELIERAGQKFIVDLESGIINNNSEYRGICIESLDKLLIAKGDLFDFIQENQNSEGIDIHSLKSIYEDISHTLERLIEIMGYNYPQYFTDSKFSKLVREFLPSNHPHQERITRPAVPNQKVLGYILNYLHLAGQFTPPGRTDINSWRKVAREYNPKWDRPQSGKSIYNEFKDYYTTKRFDGSLERKKEPDTIKKAIEIMYDRNMDREAILIARKEYESSI